MQHLNLNAARFRKSRIFREFPGIRSPA